MAALHQNKNLVAYLAKSIANVKVSRRESGSRVLSHASSISSEVLSLIESERRKASCVGLVHYNMALSLYRRLGSVHHCNTLLEWMQTDKIKGSTETYSYVLRTYLTRYDNFPNTALDMMRIWKLMKKERIYPDSHCYGAVMGLAVKDMEAGILTQPEAKTKCLLIFKEMIDKRHKPGGQHYISLLQVSEDENSATNLLEWCLSNDVTVLPFHWLAMLKLFNRLSADAKDFQEKFSMLERLMNKHHVGMARALGYEPLRVLCKYKLYEIGLGIYKKKLKYHHPPTVAEGVYIILILRGVSMNLLKDKESRPSDGESIDKEVESLRVLCKEIVEDIQSRCISHMRTSPLFWEAYIDFLIDTTDYASAKSILTLLLVEGSITTYKTERRAVQELGMNPYMPDRDLPTSESAKQLRKKGFAFDSSFQMRKNH